MYSVMGHERCFQMARLCLFFRVCNSSKIQLVQKNISEKSFHVSLIERGLIQRNGSDLSCPHLSTLLLQFHQETINVSFLSQGFHSNPGFMFCFYVTLHHTGNLLLHQYDPNNEVNEIVTDRFMTQKNANVVAPASYPQSYCFPENFPTLGLQPTMLQDFPKLTRGHVTANVGHGVPPRGPKSI